MKRRIRPSIFLLMVSAAVWLWGCSAAGPNTSMKDHTEMVSETTAAANDTVMIPEAAMAKSTEFGSGAISQSNDTPPEDGNTGEASSPLSPPVSSNRKLIRNVEMAIETDQFDSLLQTITNQVTAAGGYTERSSIQGKGINYSNEWLPRSADLLVRIPSDKLDTFTGTMDTSGNVTQKSEYTSDVTLQYSDIESRRKSLLVEQDRIWSLLEKADTLEAVISLEQRLTDIRYELESMESQLRLYDNQVSYSTVTLYIQEVQRYTEPVTPSPSPLTFWERISSGLEKNTKSMVQFLESLLIFLISGLPIWIPLLVMIAAVVALSPKRRKASKKPFIEEPDKNKVRDSGKKEE